VSPARDAQWQRLHRLDPRLPGRDRDRAADPDQPVVRHGALSVATSRLVLDPDSEMLGFFAATSYDAAQTMLPEPAAPGSGEDAVALLREWRSLLPWDGDCAHAITWPSADAAAAKWFETAGLPANAHIAVRPAGPVPTRRAATELDVRRAGPDDLDAVVALHVDEVGFHVGRDPSIRVGGQHRERHPGALSLHDVADPGRAR
jgi:hypothetical protein